MNLTKEKFIEELTEILQTDEKLNEQTILNDIEEWDSVAKISLISFFDSKFNIDLKSKQIEEFKTVKDIIKTAGL